MRFMSWLLISRGCNWSQSVQRMLTAQVCLFLGGVGGRTWKVSHKQVFLASVSVSRSFNFTDTSLHFLFECGNIQTASGNTCWRIYLLRRQILSGCRAHHLISLLSVSSSGQGEWLDMVSNWLHSVLWTTLSLPCLGPCDELQCSGHWPYFLLWLPFCFVLKTKNRVHTNFQECHKNQPILINSRVFMQCHVTGHMFF